MSKSLPLFNAGMGISRFQTNLLMETIFYFRAGIRDNAFNLIKVSRIAKVPLSGKIILTLRTSKLLRFRTWI
jgi:hypothetical protein